MLNHSYNVALIQINSSSVVEDNLNKIEKLVKEASKKAELVILPEHADAIGKHDSDFAQSIDGKSVSFYKELAKACSVYLHIGSFAENGIEGKPFNTSILISPSGEILAKYSKLHLFDVDLPDGTGVRESNGATAGSEIVVAKTDIGNIGLSICYDLRFPELYRKMALMGADMFVVSANFTAQTGKRHWKPLLQARAIENACYVLACNQCKTNEQFEAWGHSMLISPWGEVIAELEQEEGILYGAVEQAEIDNARNKIPSIKNRRIDVY